MLLGTLLIPCAGIACSAIFGVSRWVVTVVVSKPQFSALEHSRRDHSLRSDLDGRIYVDASSDALCYDAEILKNS
jgi:hypothetical protein